MAQFFLSSAARVSFAAGSVPAFAMTAPTPEAEAPRLLAHGGAGLLLRLLVAYRVAVFRFRALTGSIWSVPHRRHQTPELSLSDR